MRKALPPIPDPEPTHEDRLLAATLKAGAARSAFLIAALDLENAADDLDILAADTQKELDRLTDILTAAIQDSDAHRVSAGKLRGLVGAADEIPAQLLLF